MLRCVPACRASTISALGVVGEGKSRRSPRAGAADWARDRLAMGRHPRIPSGACRRAFGMSTVRPSLRSAINAMCKECIYDPRSGNGTWVEQVANCTAPRCPLYPVRAGRDRVSEPHKTALTGLNSGALR